MSELVHLNYGYDWASNRTFRRDEVARSHSAQFDELYGYDGLNRNSGIAQKINRHRFYRQMLSTCTMIVALAPVVQTISRTILNAASRSSW